jgi:hypothetical protein
MNPINKASRVAYAVAAALGTSGAHATLPTTTPDLTVYAGGGSAEPQPVEAAFCRNFSNVDLYTDTGAATQSASYLVLYGTSTGANAGFPSGKNVLFIYKFNGGSYPNGAVPQTTGGGTLNFPTVNSILNTSSLIGAGSTQGTACTATQKGLPTYTYTIAVGNNVQPAFGVTDLEVGAFAGFNNPTGALSGTTWIPSPLVTVGKADLAYDLVEGVAVTNSLYTGAVAGTNAKTNFSRAEVAAILSGYVTDWNQIYADNGSPVAPSGTPIILIDRNVGSGTKAAGSLYFLGYPAAGGNSLLPNSETNTWHTGKGTGNGALSNAPYNAGYSSGSLVTTQTLQDIQEKSSASVVTDLINADTNSLLAIAILSADNPQAYSPTTGHYDFVKVNNTAMDTYGQSIPAPITNDNINGTVGSSYLNVISGSYDFFYQVNVNAQSSGALTGDNAADANTFAAAMLSVMQNPSLTGVNSGSVFPLATNGIVADADRNATLAKGVTVVTRGGNSAGALKPALTQTIGTIVAGKDPL